MFLVEITGSGIDETEAKSRSFTFLQIADFLKPTGPSLNLGRSAPQQFSSDKLPIKIELFERLQTTVFTLARLIREQKFARALCTPPVRTINFNSVLWMDSCFHLFQLEGVCDYSLFRTEYGRGSKKGNRGLKSINLVNQAAWTRNSVIRRTNTLYFCFTDESLLRSLGAINLRPDRQTYNRTSRCTYAP